MDHWRSNLVEDSAGVSRLLSEANRVAVLGIKTERQNFQPAYYVPEYLSHSGYDVVPVPTYYPDVQEILGKPVYRTVAEIPEPVDLVLVFRRSQDVLQHVDDLLAARPGAVWMQSGIRNEEAARRLAEAGIKVVQDRCAMVEHRRSR
jgi:uncharacterized protein